MAKSTSLPPGLVLRNRTYWADFRAGGRRVRKSLSTNLKTASQLLIELKARAERGEFGLLDNDFPVDDLRKQYLRHVRQSCKPSSAARYEQSLDAILPSLPKRVSQITATAIVQYREKRIADGASPSTVNYDVQALGAMFRWGVQNRVIADNPVANLKRLRHDQPNERRPLTDEEVHLLLDASPERWRDLWYCLLTTGMRVMEAASLRFIDVDWESRELVVRRGVSKNHRPRRIPLDDGLGEIIKRLDAGRESRQPGVGKRTEDTSRVRELFTKEHIFTTGQYTPLNRSSAYRGFMRCCTAAAIEIKTIDDEGREVHVDVHSLRQTFASALIAAGVNPKAVQELLGHATLAMTMNLYTKSNSQTRRQAIGSLSYGGGASVPEHLITLASVRNQDQGDGHNLVTPPQTRLRKDR